MALLGRRSEQTDEIQPYVVPPGQESLFPPLPPAPQAAPRRRRWPLAVAIAAVLVGAGAGGSVVYLTTRGPDLADFERGLEQATALAISLQRATDTLNAADDLDSFSSALVVRREDLAELERQAEAVETSVHRLALLALVDAESRYLAELGRVADLPATSSPEGRAERARELANSVSRALATATALLDRPQTAVEVEISPAALTEVLTERHEAWQQAKAAYADQLAEAKQINARRARQLSALKAFTGQFDGIIGRYSRSRHELAAWIDKVNAYGATYGEAYEVLYQQASRRRAFRDELAALRAPAEFASHQQAVLALMDRAIDATEAASRGISEYQSSYAYPYYDETPGWLTFEEASNQISRDYTRVLGDYDARKKALFARLSKKVPLPDPPSAS